MQPRFQPNSLMNLICYHVSKTKPTLTNFRLNTSSTNKNRIYERIYLELGILKSQHSLLVNTICYFDPKW